LYAIQKNDIDLMKHLIKIQKKIVNAILDKKSDKAALHFLAEHANEENREMIQLLLEAKADINLKTKKVLRTTPEIAIRNENTVFLDLVLKLRDIDIIKVQNDGWSYLEYAVCHFRPKSTEALLKAKGNQINHSLKDEAGDTFLHRVMKELCAAIKQQPHEMSVAVECFKLILQHSNIQLQDFQRKNARGQTPFEYAKAQTAVKNELLKEMEALIASKKDPLAKSKLEEKVLSETAGDQKNPVATDAASITTEITYGGLTATVFKKPKEFEARSKEDKEFGITPKSLVRWLEFSKEILTVPARPAASDLEEENEPDKPIVVAKLSDQQIKSHKMLLAELNSMNARCSHGDVEWGLYLTKDKELCYGFFIESNDAAVDARRRIEAEFQKIFPDLKVMKTSIDGMRGRVVYFDSLLNAFENNPQIFRQMQAQRRK
jgi:hypothetical protein